jgi:RNA-directed DNA polymerase
VLRGSRGDAAGIELGSSFAERIAVNTGTVPVCPAARSQRGGLGWARCRPTGLGRGGAAVVLRAGESPAHGEGRQRFREGKEAAMPQEAPPDGGARDDVPQGSWSRVAGMQAKLHRWAAADPGRRFDDLFNFVCDPATLIVAFDRVAGNRGANTPGVDGMTVKLVEERTGVPGFLDDLRAQLKSGTFRPLPVRERKIPKPGGSGKLRKLGIPAVADKVVQAALKLVLEPIFEAGFEPVSYGFRPMRRAHDAIAEIHVFGTNGYRWVLDADIEAAFDNLSHSAVMDRVRARVKDKRVLALVKAFLKAGVITELGHHQDTWTGTPQGGLCSAEHNPPYEQCRVMRSAGLLALVTAMLALEHCA